MQGAGGEGVSEGVSEEEVRGVRGLNQREVMELIREAKSLPALVAAIKSSDTDTVLHNWAMRTYLDMRAREKGVPLNGAFELTPLCNLDCKMCYVHLNAEQLQDRKLLQADEWERIMNEAIEAGMMYASLTGGECLTYPEFDRLYMYLHSRGIQISVLTNGILLDENRIDFFKKHPPSGIQVTLYGADEEMYERVTGRRVFSKVLKNILNAEAAELPIVVAITPNEFLGSDNEVLVRFAAQCGIRTRMNSYLMNPRKETGRDQNFCDMHAEDYVNLHKLQLQLAGFEIPSECEVVLHAPQGGNVEPPKGLRCGGGCSCFSVTWRGEMIPCNGFEEIKKSLLQNSFAVAWKYVRQFATNFPLPRECEDCQYREAARTCAAVHKAECGHADPLQCEWCMAMVKAGLADLS